MKLLKSVAKLTLRIGLLASWGAASLAHPAAAKSTKAKQIDRTLDQFDIRKEPTRADWRYFIRAPEAAREALWEHHAKTGLSLASWSWGWRLGWVRVCGGSTRPFCERILQDALFDKALVVRAEAATRYGRRLEGSADPSAATLLAKAYSNPRNIRAGKPLFVQNRILFALHNIGGNEAETVATQLADRHPETKEYWGKLALADAKLSKATVLE